MKKLFIIISCIIGILGASNAQMVLEYDIAVANTKIEIPLNGSVNVNIDWGDGSVLESFNTKGNKIHTYTITGIKTVTISGTLTEFGSNYQLQGTQGLQK